jgi:hypothetical protein
LLALVRPCILAHCCLRHNNHLHHRAADRQLGSAARVGCWRPASVANPAARLRHTSVREPLPPAACLLFSCVWRLLWGAYPKQSCWQRQPCYMAVPPSSCSRIVRLALPAAVSICQQPGTAKSSSILFNSHTRKFLRVYYSQTSAMRGVRCLGTCCRCNGLPMRPLRC